MDGMNALRFDVSNGCWIHLRCGVLTPQVSMPHCHVRKQHTLTWCRDWIWCIAEVKRRPKYDSAHLTVHLQYAYDVTYHPHHLWLGILKLRTFSILTPLIGNYVLLLFGPPRSGWDLWFSFRSFVRLAVRSSVRSVEISKTAHRIVLIFGTKL